MARIVGIGLCLSLSLVASPCQAQAKKEALVDKVKSSIDSGVRFLRENQRADGGWEVNLPSARIYGGWSALAMLSLINAGVPMDDPMMSRGMGFLRRIEPTSVYVRALQTMVFVDGKQVEDKERVAANVRWLIDARIVKGGQLHGWTYDRGPGTVADNSNTQYALLGLWAGKQGGAAINREIWQSIQDFYLRTQQKDGGWPYAPDGIDARDPPTMTMTTAGLCGLIIAGMELNVGREVIGAGGAAKNCGRYDDTAATSRAMSWINERRTVEIAGKTFYHLYGLERAGRLTGERFFGDFDWYREGCDWLVRNQKADGSWVARGMWDQWPVISTSFSLLFLSKGRTPVLMSKLVHYNRERADDSDWNNDRNDLRHLVEFTSKHVFKELPLAWQSFDATRAFSGRGVINDEAVADVTGELLQSPVLYITGHKSLLARITGAERKVLKRFVESGGFIFVEACCGSKDFDAGFKEFIKHEDLWPDNDLAELAPTHAVWKSHFLIKPGDPYPLYGISMGCKTILIYSPRDMSCLWENNLFEDRLGLGERAFKLGANIIAYATGKEPPRPRLFEMEAVREEGKGPAIERGHLKAAQLRFRGGDWQPAPQAMVNLMKHVSRQAGINVVPTPTPLFVSNKGVTQHKFIYLHARSPFSFDGEPLDGLRLNLENGGLLFADACCGSEEFDRSFRKFAAQLFPDHKLERVPEDDLLYSAKLGGVKLDSATIKARIKSGEEPRAMAPLLEGIRIDGRWVVLYSKYDIGCALERHSSSDCRGYTPESALRIATAAVLYTFWPSWKD